MNSKLFYQYYDLIFQAKEYDSEVQKALSIAGYDQAKPKGILEIGCGTGAHTKALALGQKNVPITAIDIDSDMVELSRMNMRDFEQVEILQTRIEDLELRGFSVVLALFNVVMYIGSFSDLTSFFRGVYLALDDGGAFVFDCWNGVAALRDPPGGKETTFEDDRVSLHCLLDSSTDFLKQLTVLTYTISVRNKDTGVAESGAHSFQQNLWTPNQVFDALQIAGFSDAEYFTFMEPSVPATHDSWKITFSCRK